MAWIGEVQEVLYTLWKYFRPAEISWLLPYAEYVDIHDASAANCIAIIATASYIVHQKLTHFWRVGVITSKPIP